MKKEASLVIPVTKPTIHLPSQSEQPTAPSSATQTATKSSEDEEKLPCDKVLCVDSEGVHYTDKTGKTILVAKDVRDESNPVNSYGYKFAELSPNGKFISLGGTHWEAVIFEVYEISTGKTYPVDATGFDWGHWTIDNRLFVSGQCGMGIDCGVYISKSDSNPWVLEKVSDPLVIWTK